MNALFATPIQPEHVTASAGTLVRLEASHWFEQPDFCAWVNARTGKGLASWQPSDQSLQISQLPADTCAELADQLSDSVLQADLLFEPIPLGTDEDYEAECDRVARADRLLSTIHSELQRHAANNLALTPSTASKLIQKLDRVDELDAFTDTESVKLADAHATLEKCRAYLRLVDADATQGYSDVFVAVEPACNGEGSDSDMPDAYWNQVVEFAKAYRTGRETSHIIVQICS